MKHEEQKTVVEIGQLIKSERKRQGVTQMQLAGIAGTGIRFISDLENGKGTIQVQKLLKVLQTLGLGLFIYSPWDNKRWNNSPIYHDIVQGIHRRIQQLA